MQKFSYLIFDLGNVIIDIDYNRPIAGFQALVAPNSGFKFQDVLSYTAQNHIFDDFERGTLSAAGFRSQLRQFFRPAVTDAEIDAAWNSILVAYPPAKFELLRQLKARYHTMALSNINEIHVQAINKAAREQLNAGAFADFFHKAYYSNEMGHRKPDKEIYEMLIQQENLNAGQAFFVDDKLENVEAARRVGIQAWHLPEREKLHDLLAELNII